MEWLLRFVFCDGNNNFDLFQAFLQALHRSGMAAGTVRPFENKMLESRSLTMVRDKLCINGHEPQNETQIFCIQYLPTLYCYHHTVYSVGIGLFDNIDFLNDIYFAIMFLFNNISSSTGKYFFFRKNSYFYVSLQQNELRLITLKNEFKYLETHQNIFFNFKF